MEGEDLARGPGRAVAHDDDAPEDVAQFAGGGVVDGGGALEHAAQEPAGAVDPEEADLDRAGGALGVAHGDLGDDLDAVLAFDLLGAGPGAAELVEDVGAELIPDPLGAGGGEGAQLERRAAQDEGDGLDAAAGAGGLHAQLHAVDGGDPQGAQVDAVVVAVVADLFGVPGAVGRAGGALLGCLDEGIVAVPGGAGGAPGGGVIIAALALAAGEQCHGGSFGTGFLGAVGRQPAQSVHTGSPVASSM
ncbi:hypothetical protein ADENT20671_0807 [Actinomyces denticolens]|nr:hypothetical protein ADENT20671_0807 [Actinomyces denticolens]